jgi:hypothetical protein
MALREGRGIATGETCIPASLNENLGEAAVLLFSVSCQGCAYLSLQGKAINCISPCLCPVLRGFNLLPTAAETSGQIIFKTSIAAIGIPSNICKTGKQKRPVIAVAELY